MKLIVYIESLSALFFLSIWWGLQDLGGWGSLLYPGRKHCPLPDMIFRGEERQRRKPQRHQFRDLTQTLWGCEVKLVGHIDILLNNQIPPMKVHYSLKRTTKNLCYTREICLACTMFVGVETYEWDQCFHIMSLGLFISLMANDPVFCEGFSPIPDWSTRPLPCV